MLERTFQEGSRLGGPQPIPHRTRLRLAVQQLGDAAKIQCCPEQLFSAARPANRDSIHEI